MESLTKPELLMLFSILEGELEARDLVIDALRAQRKDVYIQERYGRYNLSDPFLALQRDSEAVGAQTKDPGGASSTSNPLVVLKLVVSHCRRMQEKMLSQLAAAESRHRRVIVDLEEEKRRHAEDTAEGDDVTYILEKERERLLQQLEFERSQVRRLEKEQRRMTDQLEEERAQHKQLSCALAKECKWASARALEEGHRLTELGRKLEKEQEASQALRKELVEERRRALRMEARVEEQLAEFDTEREQLRSRLKREEAHCCQLQQQVEGLSRKLEMVKMEEEEGGVKEEGKVSVEGGGKEEWAKSVPLAKTRGEPIKTDDMEEEEVNLQPAQPEVNGHHLQPAQPQVNGHHLPPAQPQVNGHHLPPAQPEVNRHHLPPAQPEVNGHHPPLETNGHHGPNDDHYASSEKIYLENGNDTSNSFAPASHLSQTSLSPCGTDPSCLTSSPCSSPVLAKRPPDSPRQSSYQAGINQRFHAARHRFQGTADPELQPQSQPQPQASQPASPQPPKDLSPSPSPSPEASPVKQLARSTVTQALSRFTTVQQSAAAKLPTPNNSPFGTDYRSLAAPLSPIIGRASVVLPQGVRSPTIPRADRGNPPPIPPKKPGLAQAPPSPAPVPRSASHFPDAPLSGSCGLTTSQEGVKELDMVVSSN